MRRFYAVAAVAAAGVVVGGLDRAGGGPYRPPGVSEEIILVETVSLETVNQERVSGRIDREPADRAKYSELLRKIEVPGDRQAYGDFYDWGYWSGSEWGGHTGLPAGYWVYVDGTWYIFGKLHGESAPPPVVTDAPAATQSGEKRSWGPEQAVGPPDTPVAGDYATAWASESADGQAEWLSVTFEPVDAVAVIIYQTYNPGAVSTVTVFDTQGGQRAVFEGQAAEAALPLTRRDGAAAGARPKLLVIPLDAAPPINQVKLDIDSVRVAGWNEIDAVGLLDARGTMHWAIGATASSTYAARGD